MATNQLSELGKAVNKIFFYIIIIKKSKLSEHIFLTNSWASEIQMQSRPLAWSGDVRAQLSFEFQRKWLAI